MNPRVSVVFGRREDHGRRDELWRWTRDRWEALFPDFEVVTGDTDDDHFRFGPATNAARAKATGDIIIGTEADTVFEPEFIARAVDLAAVGAWVLPEEYRQLTEADTDRLLTVSPDVARIEHGDTEWTGYGVSWAGYLIARRELWDRVAGYDERIDAWGPMDGCLALALGTLIGPHCRLPGAAYHLWHPVSQAETWHSESYAHGRVVFAEYEAAWGDVPAMEAVVARNREAQR